LRCATILVVVVTAIVVVAIIVVAIVVIAIIVVVSIIVAIIVVTAVVVVVVAVIVITTTITMIVPVIGPWTMTMDVDFAVVRDIGYGWRCSDTKDLSDIDVSAVIVDLRVIHVQHVQGDTCLVADILTGIAGLDDISVCAVFACVSKTEVLAGVEVGAVLVDGAVVDYG